MPRCTSLRVPEAGFLSQRVRTLWQLTVKIALEFLPDPILKWPHTVKVRFHCYLLFPKGLIHDSHAGEDVFFFFFPTCRKTNPFTLTHVKRRLISQRVNLIFCLDNLCQLLKYLNISMLLGKSCYPTRLFQPLGSLPQDFPHLPTLTPGTTSNHSVPNILVVKYFL